MNDAVSVAHSGGLRVRGPVHLCTPSRPLYFTGRYHKSAVSPPTTHGGHVGAHWCLHAAQPLKK
ncbi:hypothetical protein E2C01_007036 [Portunus trituberculatus]|uniref:Uncharacterized protein n=1 Tax=Portunus trituberculatus TaxID=210409 RepID=A0A5B7D3F2_PORTR|nr:hypothetical protein [Portunus trituberculatus]